MHITTRKKLIRCIERKCSSRKAEEAEKFHQETQRLCLDMLVELEDGCTADDVWTAPASVEVAFLQFLGKRGNLLDLVAWFHSVTIVRNEIAWACLFSQFLQNESFFATELTIVEFVNSVPDYLLNEQGELAPTDKGTLALCVYSQLMKTDAQMASNPTESKKSCLACLIS